MPLFMDIHLVGEISVEDTRKAHLADLAVQEKYGVNTTSIGLMKKPELFIVSWKAPTRNRVQQPTERPMELLRAR
jgi:hypothetical protein